LSLKICINWMNGRVNGDCRNLAGRRGVSHPQTGPHGQTDKIELNGPLTRENEGTNEWSAVRGKRPTAIDVHSKFKWSIYAPSVHRAFDFFVWKGGATAPPDGRRVATWRGDKLHRTVDPSFGLCFSLDFTEFHWNFEASETFNSFWMNEINILIAIISF